MPSEVKTQKTLEFSRLGDLEMSGRLFLTGNKIWINQVRKARPVSEENSSKNQPPSQERLYNKSFIKILNRLSYLNILDRVQREIEENSNSSSLKIDSLHQIPLTDEYIANIFGPPQNQDDPEAPLQPNNPLTQSNN
jgi:hypothetical protein